MFANHCALKAGALRTIHLLRKALKMSNDICNETWKRSKLKNKE